MTEQLTTHKVIYASIIRKAQYTYQMYVYIPNHSKHIKVKYNLTFTTIQIVLEFLPRAIRQEKETKAYRLQKQNKPLFVKDMILHMENLRKFT